MREHAQRRAALDKTVVVEITAVGDTASLRLKTWLPDLTERPVALAGLDLPSQVGATLSGPMRMLCVGPGEWLLVSHEHQRFSLRARIERDLPKHGLALVDLTDGLAALEVRGSGARELLSKGCGLDMHPRSFPAGRCARTRFAQIPVLIDCLDESARFELRVARSYFHYLYAWLTDAAAEFAGPLA